jgi:sarcosine oxidase
MSANNYEVRVIGLDALGSATIYHLARRGVKVLGLHTPTINRTGSILIRESAYRKETPLSRALELWRQLEAESGSTFLHINGGLTIGTPGSTLVKNTLDIIHNHNLLNWQVSPGAISRISSCFQLPESVSAIYKPNSGYFQAGAAVSATLQVAARAGAVLKHGEDITGWSHYGNKVVVGTSRETYQADRLIITGEKPRAVNSGNVPVYQRTITASFRPNHPADFLPEKFPVFSLDIPEGRFEGFPLLPGQIMKIRQYRYGEAAVPPVDYRAVAENIRLVLAQYLPGSTGEAEFSPVITSELYQSGETILSRHPRFRQVLLATELAEEDYPVSNLLGEKLANMADITGSRYSEKYWYSLDHYPAPFLPVI